MMIICWSILAQNGHYPVNSLVLTESRNSGVTPVGGVDDDYQLNAAFDSFGDLTYFTDDAERVR